MSLSSGYMVTVLCRHRRRSRHLHSTSLSAKASPELRATRTILLLLGFFMVRSIMDYVISASRIMWNNDPILYYIQIFIDDSYAAVSPLVFISTEKCIIIFLKFMWGRTINA
jgi:vomeronasal1 receptor